MLTLFAAVITAVACPGLALASTQVFTPVADSYVTSSRAKKNYGSAAGLETKSSAPIVQSYLRFDVQLPAGATITAARLELSTTSLSSLAGYKVHPVSDTSWGELSISYSNAPAFGAQLGSSGGWSTTGYKTVPLPASAVRAGLNSFGVSTSSSSRLVFASREALNKPRLVVTYTSPSGDPVIAAAGDIACAPGGTVGSTTCQQRATSDLLTGATGVLTLGDNQYETGALTAFQQSFDPTWGRFRSVMHPAPGNHEYGTSGASGYFSYFGSIAGEPGKGWYSYDVGAWHLVALNSSKNCSPVPCGAGSAQEQWLKADLAAHSNRCTLAYWHHPRFSSGQHGSLTGSSTFWSDLYAAGADVVLNGHDHDYERFAPQNSSGQLDTARGIREFVVGTGGKNHYGFSTTIANSQVRQSNTFGVLKLTLHAGSYDWKFVPVAGATFSDTGSASCH